MIVRKDEKRFPYFFYYGITDEYLLEHRRWVDADLESLWELDSIHLAMVETSNHHWKRVTKVIRHAPEQYELWYLEQDGAGIRDDTITILSNLPSSLPVKISFA